MKEQNEYLQKLGDMIAKYKRKGLSKPEIEEFILRELGYTIVRTAKGRLNLKRLWL